jgi:hypothetical protein
MTPRSARPAERGTRSEGAVLAALLKLGKKVLVPYGGTSSYDLVVDEGGRFLRIQVKTGWLCNGVVTFNVCTQPRGRLRRSYRGMIDLFAVYSPELDAVYVVPIESVSTGNSVRLRLEPTRNGQEKGVTWAEPYLLGPNWDPLGRIGEHPPP